MRERLLVIIVVILLASSALVGCSQNPSAASTLTILSITEGNVFVMKAGTDSWIEAQVGMSLEPGDMMKTDDGSSAEITFFDGSTIELWADTSIEIVSLDTSADTGSTTITLEQTIGTTLSRVIKLLDPASRYEIETPTGVAAVRGSVMLVRVGEDGTTWIINQEGIIWAFAQGVELQIPEGRTGIIVFGQPPELIPLNDPPVAEDDAAITDEDNPVAVAPSGVLHNDSDPDVGDSLAVMAVDTSGTVGAVTTWDADGSFTYDPNGQFEHLQAGGSTTDSFDYTASDGNGGMDTATATITIHGVNDAPTGISLHNGSVAENQPSGTVVGNFSTTDPDTGDTFTYSLMSGEGDHDNARFTIAGSQLQTVVRFNYETKNSYSIRVRTTDSGSLYYEEAFSITITDINDPPVAVNDSATTLEDTPVTVDVLNNDSDADGDTLTVDSVTQGVNGSVTNSGSDVTYSPDSGFDGTDSFTYTISDGNGRTDRATVTITIHGVNDAPTGLSLDNSSVAENQPSGTAVGGFSTTDPDTGDTFIYSLVNGQGDDDNAAFAMAGNQLQTAASFDYETRNSYSVRVRTTDSGTLHYEQAFTITVTDVNDPPVAVNDSATTPEDTPVTIGVLSNDSDVEGDTLTVESVSQGTNGSVINNGGDVTYSPEPGFSGTDSFTYTVSDGNGGTDTATVTVTVTATDTGTSAKIRVQIDTGPTASLFIWDDTTNWWAVDECGHKLVDGTNHATPHTITVAGGHYYYVWVEATDIIYYVKTCPEGWITTSAPKGDGEAAYGYAATDSVAVVSFTVNNGSG